MRSNNQTEERNEAAGQSRLAHECEVAEVDREAVDDGGRSPPRKPPPAGESEVDGDEETEISLLDLVPALGLGLGMGRA